MRAGAGSGGWRGPSMRAFMRSRIIHGTRTFRVGLGQEFAGTDAINETAFFEGALGVFV